MRVLALLMLLDGLAVLLARWSLVPAFDGTLFAAAYLLSGGICVATLFLKKESRHLTWFLPLTALFFRFLLLTPSPLLSNDVYRYLWDGTLLRHGIHPLAHAPSELTLPGLVPPPDHASIPSVYPPLALLYFALLSLWASPLCFSIGASLLDAASTLLLARTLRERNLPLRFAFLFAWHPLAIVESGHSGHVESLGIFFLCLALRYSSSLPLACAGLTKLWPASLLVLKWRQKSFRIGLALLLVPVLVLWGTAGEIRGLSIYLSRWEFHAGIYSLLKVLAGGAVARALLLALFVSILIFLARSPLPFEKAGLWTVGAFLLCSPTVHPWYALWLLPFLVFEREPLWIYFSLAVASAYAVLPDYLAAGRWDEPLWPRCLTYLPLLLFVRRAKKVYLLIKS